MNVKDRAGQTSGGLTFIKFLRIDENHRAVWLCRCEKCGKEFETTAKHINENKSCGCWRVERLIKHGQAGHRTGGKSRIYSVWGGMKARCGNPKNKAFKNYGGKGIQVCDEWLGENGFDNFYRWAIKNGYEDRDCPRKNQLSIDRIDPSKNYCPENCRWLSISENTSRARKKDLNEN